MLEKGWEVRLERPAEGECSGPWDHDEGGPVAGQWQEDPGAGRSWEMSAPHPSPPQVFDPAKSLVGVQ